ncbi:unnamed protein product [Lota lota]
MNRGPPPQWISPAARHAPVVRDASVCRYFCKTSTSPPWLARELRTSAFLNGSEDVLFHCTAAALKMAAVCAHIPDTLPPLPQQKKKHMTVFRKIRMCYVELPKHHRIMKNFL